MNRWLGLVLWLVITFAAAAIGSLFEPGEWYAGLNKPAWTPPSAVFGPVWSILYVMMGVAAWLIWKERGFANARLALGLYFAQLTANAAWSWLFFGLRRPGYALLDIVVLWLLVAATLFAFWRIRRAAGWLLVPYLLWISFAAALNLAIRQLNV